MTNYDPSLLLIVRPTRGERAVRRRAYRDTRLIEWRANGVVLEPLNGDRFTVDLEPDEFIVAPTTGQKPSNKPLETCPRGQ